MMIRGDYIEQQIKTLSHSESSGSSKPKTLAKGYIPSSNFNFKEISWSKIMNRFPQPDSPAEVHSE